MQYFRSICRLGLCVFAICGAQAFSQTASTPSTPQTAGTQPAAANPGTDTKSTAPIIPGLSNLPTSQSGPPQTPDNQKTVAPVGLQISSGDLLDINVYGVPDLAQTVRVSNSGD